MGREWKIPGLHDDKKDEWLKLVYVHSNSDGKTCVNGHETALRINRAGENGFAGDGFSIVVPPDAEFSKGEFLSVNSGETMLKIADTSVSAVCPGFIGVSASM